MRPRLRKNQLLALQARDWSSYCGGYQRQWQGPGEESRNVKVSVWWDFENCPVPAGIDASELAPAITEAVRASGIKGPLRINAFGDVLRFSKPNQHSLPHTGIHFTHIPGGKNNADRFLLVDLMDWVSQNPPPAHLFLISGDRDFAGTLHRLRMNNYNILLASPDNAPHVLCSAATISWHWSSLVKGEYLSRKHFNPPPLTLLASSYGNCKVTLQNPFSAVQHSTSSPKADICQPSSDLMLDAFSKSVVRQIWCILRSHPKGILIGDLRAELTKHNVSFGKSFYGYKSFSRFISSVPQVELEPLGNGNFRVCLVPSESPKPFEGSALESMKYAVKVYERGSAATPKVNGEDKDKAREANGTPLTASSHERSMHDDSKSFQPVTSQVKPVVEYVDAKSSLSLVERRVPQPPNELQKSSLCSVKVVDMSTAQLSKIQPPLKSKSSSDDDIFESEDASHKIQEKYTTSRNHSAGNDQTAVEDIGTANYESGNFRATNKFENPTRKEVDEVCHRPYSSPVDDSLVDKKPGGSDETYRKGPTFFVWAKNWWQFWKGNPKSGDSIAHQNKVVSHFEDSNSSELNQTVQTVSDFEEPKLLELENNATN
ncbi:hypothetical protein CR513_51571, partial [Mucuna pruriens]